MAFDRWSKVCRTVGDADEAHRLTTGQRYTGQTHLAVGSADEAHLAVGGPDHLEADHQVRPVVLRRRKPGVNHLTAGQSRPLEVRTVSTRTSRPAPGRVKHWSSTGQKLVKHWSSDRRRAAPCRGGEEGAGAERDDAAVAQQAQPAAAAAPDSREPTSPRRCERPREYSTRSAHA
jgi:hypothetical protein